jgi:hypothetical protein
MQLYQVHYVDLKTLVCTNAYFASHAHFERGLPALIYRSVGSYGQVFNENLVCRLMTVAEADRLLYEAEQITALCLEWLQDTWVSGCLLPVCSQFGQVVYHGEVGF